MKKKYIKLGIIAAILVIIGVLIFVIYKNLFADSNATRNSELSKYKITSTEIKDAKAVIKKIEDVKSVKIYTSNDSKIIKIVVKLNKEVPLDKIKAAAQESITKFSEKNLKYYDIEFFVDTVEESKVYPKIGSKYRSREKFSW